MISYFISDDISRWMKNFNMLINHSNVLLQFRLKLEHCKSHKAARHPTTCDVINEVLTVYRRIYCRKFLSLSNQMSHYKSKCIRIAFNSLKLCMAQILKTPKNLFLFIDKCKWNDCFYMTLSILALSTGFKSWLIKRYYILVFYTCR